MSRRKKHRKSGKRLAYGVIAVIFILLCFATYSYLNPSNQNSPNSLPPDQLSSKAAIIDHLSFKEETKNETFQNASTSILETAGFNVTYYPGEKVTVDFYRNLVSQNYGLIVFRVHSAIIYGLGDNRSLGLFTSQREDESKYNTTSAPYYDDVANKRIVRAYFPDDPTTKYFAIAPAFVDKYGNFSNAVVLLMGCDGLKYNRMVDAFKRKGAKVCVGWDGLVSSPHTDHAIAYLLQRLAQRNTVEEAVEKTVNEVGPEEMYFESQGYNSTLKYYPSTAGNYVVRCVLGISSIDTLKVNAILTEQEKRNQTKFVVRA